MSAREVDRQAADSSRRGKPPSGRDSGRELPRSSALEERYRSLFVLGRGGMGSVEAALEITELSKGSPERATPTDYRRVVALKRLLPDAARDSRRSEMFLREARVAAMLDHPNVVRAFDYGEIDGEMFLAMEYVEGQPLSRVLRAIADAKKTLSPAFVAWMLAEVCEGLHAAHELKGENGETLNLVHRDVSPQNVMLGYDGRVRLLDFGVAKIETENVTKTGEVKGKTAYMSPEQAMGEAIDRRSDLFGVGAILYECLALERMWGDGTDMEVIRRLALESPPPLEKADAKAPKELADLYLKLVAREATARPATARDASEALRAIAHEAEKEIGPEAVRALLENHFATEAAEQRERLTNALESVAPDRTDLRESYVPISSRSSEAPSSVRSRPSIPRDLSTTAPATAKSVRTEKREKRPTDTKTIAAGVIAVALVGIIAWRVSAGNAEVPSVPPAVTNTATTPTTLPSASPTPSPSPPSPSTAPSPSPPATASAQPSAHPPTTTTAAKLPPSGHTAAAPPTPPSTTRSSTSTLPLPPSTTTSTATSTAPSSPPSQRPNVDPNPI